MKTTTTFKSKNVYQLFAIVLMAIGISFSGHAAKGGNGNGNGNGGNGGDDPPPIVGGHEMKIWGDISTVADHSAGNGYDFCRDATDDSATDGGPGPFARNTRIDLTYVMAYFDVLSGCPENPVPDDPSCPGTICLGSGSTKWPYLDESEPVFWPVLTSNLEDHLADPTVPAFVRFTIDAKALDGGDANYEFYMYSNEIEGTWPLANDGDWVRVHFDRWSFGPPRWGNTKKRPHIATGGEVPFLLDGVTLEVHRNDLRADGAEDPYCDCPWSWYSDDQNGDNYADSCVAQ